MSDRPAVYIDDQIFTRQSHGGISRYFAEVMVRLAKPESPVRLVNRRPWMRNEYLLTAGMGRRLRYPEKGAHRIVRWLNRVHTVGLEADIVHHTYYYPSHLSWFPRPKVRAVTVYDMIPELFPNDAPATHRAKREYVAAADIVFCISETTKKDLLRLYGQPRGRVVVTPLGVGEEFVPGLTPLASLPERYLLFVGMRGGYKSFRVVASALADSRALSGVSLVAVGGGPFSSSEVAELKSLGIAHRVGQVPLSESDLARAYNHAIAFVFPSLYEGFGLPTLEAMASGCPVVLADSPTHREVGGEVARYFPPGDSASLAHELERLVGDPRSRRELASAGQDRAGIFTWDRTTNLTVGAYLEAVEELAR